MQISPAPARGVSPATGLAVTFEGIEKCYGARRAVNDVTLGIAAGECIALLGPNGAGKTTLLKLLLGLIKPTAGAISIDGHAPGHREIQKSVGFLPESVAFDRAATGEETLNYLARLKGVPITDCGRLLADVGLGEASRRRISTYSKGMRQRLGLAQALLGEPRLMLLDEPTSGLDPELRRQFYDVVRSLRDRGVTIVIASHALSEIEAIADRFAIINRGCILAAGALDELKVKAGLPVRLRISVADGEAPTIAERLGRSITIARVNGRHVEIECEESRKIPIVRAITGLSPAIGDLEIEPPTLEVLYAHFTRQEGQS